MAVVYLPSDRRSEVWGQALGTLVGQSLNQYQQQQISQGIADIQQDDSVKDKFYEALRRFGQPGVDRLGQMLKVQATQQALVNAQAEYAKIGADTDAAKAKATLDRARADPRTTQAQLDHLQAQTDEANAAAAAHKASMTKTQAETPLAPQMQKADITARTAEARAATALAVQRESETSTPITPPMAGGTGGAPTASPASGPPSAAPAPTSIPTPAGPSGLSLPPPQTPQGAALGIQPQGAPTSIPVPRMPVQASAAPTPTPLPAPVIRQGRQTFNTSEIAGYTDTDLQGVDDRGKYLVRQRYAQVYQSYWANPKTRDQAPAKADEAAQKVLAGYKTPTAISAAVGASASMAEGVEDFINAMLKNPEGFGGFASQMQWLRSKGWGAQNPEMATAYEAHLRVVQQAANTGQGFGGQWRVNLAKGIVPDIDKSPLYNVIGTGQTADDNLQRLQALRKGMSPTENTTAIDAAIAKWQGISDRMHTFSAVPMQSGKVTGGVKPMVQAAFFEGNEVDIRNFKTLVDKDTSYPMAGDKSQSLTGAQIIAYGKQQGKDPYSFMLQWTGRQPSVSLVVTAQ